MINVIRPAPVHLLPVAALRTDNGGFRDMLVVLHIVAVKGAERLVTQEIAEFRTFFKASFLHVA